MAITRLAISTPSANTNTALHTSVRPALVSVIAANKSTSVAATVRIWVVPSGATLDSQYAYLAYDTPVPFSNSLETFRVPIATGDVVYVRSSTADVSFSLNAIYESNGTSNISVGTSNPASPQIGDVFVNTNTSGVLYWTGSAWVNGTVDTSLYPFSKYQSAAPSAPVVGQIWVDSDDNVQYVWTGSAWTALSNPDTVTLTGTQTLTNKTLTSPVINSPVTTLSTNAQTGTTYTLALSDRDKIVELNNAAAITLTVPTNASVAFPVGSSLTIVQTGAGQVTVGGAGVTINGTPGLKLRTQWSSATLLKRATDTWLVFGDLAA